MDRHQKNNGTNYFIIQAENDGINVVIDKKPINDGDKKELKTLAKIYKDNAIEAKVAGIVGINSMTEEEYNTLKQSGNVPQEKLNEVVRYEVSLTIGKNNVTEKDVKFHNDCGLLNIKSLEAIELGIDKARKDDRFEVESGVTVIDERWRETEVALGLMLFDLLGVNQRNLEGSYTAKEADAVHCAILDNPNMIRYLINELKITITETYVPIKLVGEIIKKMFGIKQIKTVRSRSEDRRQGYVFYFVQVEKLMTYVKNRADKRQLNSESLNEAA